MFFLRNILTLCQRDRDKKSLRVVYVLNVKDTYGEVVGG